MSVQELYLLTWCVRSGKRDWVRFEYRRNLAAREVLCDNYFSYCAMQPRQTPIFLRPCASTISRWSSCSWPVKIRKRKRCSDGELRETCSEMRRPNHTEHPWAR